MRIESCDVLIEGIGWMPCLVEIRLEECIAFRVKKLYTKTEFMELYGKAFEGEDIIRRVNIPK